jgi:ABC-type glycerol-3-phosphate transport system permease component
MGTMRSAKIRGHILVYAVYLFLAILILIPVLWIVTTSFKTPIQIFAFPPKWIPSPFTMENYLAIFQRTQIPLQIINSAIVGVSSIMITLLISSLAAYGFSRYQFRGKNVVFLMLIGFQLLPVTINIVPYYILAVRLNLLNTYAILILIFTSLRIPICTLILKGFFDTIPVSIEEAGIIDGLSRVAVLFRIVFPISLPGLASASLLTFIFTWNQFLLPLILNSRPEMSLATVGVFQLSTDEALSWDLISAGTFISILPLIILFLLTQRLFISGLTRGTGK